MDDCQVEVSVGLTFDMRGDQKAQPFGHPLMEGLDGNVCGGKDSMTLRGISQPFWRHERAWASSNGSQPLARGTAGFETEASSLATQRTARPESESQTPPT